MVTVIKKDENFEICILTMQKTKIYCWNHGFNIILI